MDTTILVGDALDILRTLPDASVDSCVTDPPYDLTSIVKRFGKPGSAPVKPGKDGSFARLSRGFMGQAWDGTGLPRHTNTCFCSASGNGITTTRRRLPRNRSEQAKR